MPRLTDEHRRERLLTGPIWKTLFWMTTPLAIYAFFNYLYGFFDFLMVSTIGTTDVATVFFVEDIKGAISAIGGGIAIGGAVYVARYFGAKAFDTARHYAGQTLVFAFLVSAFFAIVTIVFGSHLMRLFNAPQEMIDTGMSYYSVQMASTVVLSINAVYMAIERSKGNTKRVMGLNIIAMIIKLALTYLMIIVLKKEIVWVALSTLIAQVFLMMIGLIYLFATNHVLTLRLTDLRWETSLVKTITVMALPIIAGKFFFSLGRVIVNGIAAIYGTTAIAAFGLATKLVGGPGAIAAIYEESTAAMASMNIGDRKVKRAFQTYVSANVQAVLIGLVGMLLVVTFIDTMIPWFTTNSSVEFATLAKHIFAFEKFSIMSSATIAIVGATFISFKLPRMSFYLNMIRLYALRIPILILLIALKVEAIALGYVMFISNTTTAIISIVLIYVYYRKIKQFGYLDMAYD